ncbi:hypothetical protein KOR42_05700 [Thalassoglobus neptunius]|uniref:Uncharacterized protein n=1 Tax=Thalassoglobus neptunius TaxID=1938619 RepID=A0A5C5X5B9_9PLAN|nr:hypothetical protein [Thalassoglobus neptunius]TWT57212.1 hypothetical protein KOR42_05700 [Thalassoglobus neptunius]
MTETTAIEQRFPQRFRYRKHGGDRWYFGVAVASSLIPDSWRIECLEQRGFGGFDSDPWELLGHIIGDVEAFEWIDNDYRWRSL